ncbi:MAG: transposase family protein [Bacteroidetes bacterium]|nr:transposase family protein [Bacteroidota bacterium]
MNNYTGGQMKRNQESTVSAKHQAGMGIILQPILKNMNINLNITEFCKILSIGRATAYVAQKELIAKLSNDFSEQIKIEELEKQRRATEAQNLEKDFMIEFYKYQLEHPDCFIDGPFKYYSDEFKQFILDQKKSYGFTFDKIFEMTQVSVNTLKKFNYTIAPNLEGTPEELPDEVIKLLNEYLRSGKKIKSVKKFCKKKPVLLKELGMNYRQILSWLSKLGFVSPKGIFLKNTGLDRIIRFKPNTLWGTDGKVINVVINGVNYRWVWQCLIDYKTTVIVGGLVAPEENTENLLSAIEASKDKTGVTPLAIVMDNRLSENLPAIKEYLDNYGIEVIKIFPGNSKSNGIVENNFHIFEKWVGGKIIIEGDNMSALSRSIAQMLVEVFTQLRNHKPFKSSSKSPQEVMDESRDNPPSEKEIEIMKVKIDELVNRNKRENAVPEISVQKQLAIKQAVAKVKPKDEETFCKRLSRSEYTHNIILEGIAIFKTRQQAYPEKNYDHTYLGGILRNLVNDSYLDCLNINLKNVYFHHYEALKKKHESGILDNLKADPVRTCCDLALDYLQMPVPSWSTMILLQLKEMFFIASCGCADTARDLCDQISNSIVNLTYEVKKKREILLCKLYEWTNFVKTYDSA